MPNPGSLARSIAIFLLCVLVWPTWAKDTPLTYDRIEFSVVSTRQVENDTLVATLYVQREGEDTGKLVDEVNRSIQWGLAQARKSSGLEVQTLDYHTSPVYRNQKLQGWRVRQSMRLESRDSSQLSQIIGILQERLAVGSIQYDVSRERRSQVESELIGEAIKEFTKRAELITAQLKRNGYRLVKMNVDTSGSPPPRRAPQLMAMRAQATVTPPALEAGTQSLQVRVSGTIELKLN